MHCPSIHGLPDQVCGLGIEPFLQWLLGGMIVTAPESSGQHTSQTDLRFKYFSVLTGMAVTLSLQTL